MKATVLPSGKLVRIEATGYKQNVSLDQAGCLRDALRRHVNQRSSVFTEDMKIGVYGSSIPQRTVVTIRGNCIAIPDSEALELADVLDDIL